MERVMDIHKELEVFTGLEFNAFEHKYTYQGKEFIHFDTQNLKTIYFLFPVRIRNAIKRLNKLVSNPENDFNKTLGIHTIGLVPIDEIQALNELGYGLSSWNTIKVYTTNKSAVSVSWSPFEGTDR